MGSIFGNVFGQATSTPTTTPAANSPAPATKAPASIFGNVFSAPNATTAAPATTTPAAPATTTPEAPADTNTPSTPITINPSPLNDFFPTATPGNNADSTAATNQPAPELGAKPGGLPGAVISADTGQAQKPTKAVLASWGMQNDGTLSPAELEGAGYTQETKNMMQSDPSKVSPLLYLKRGISFGNDVTLPGEDPNTKLSVSDLPPATTNKQKYAEAIGNILTMAVAQPFIEAGAASLFGKAASVVPGLSKVADTVKDYTTTQPWAAGYPYQIAKAFGTGSLFGAIENNKQTMAHNMLTTGATFAAFEALAYPVMTFFKPIIKEVGQASITNPDAPPTLTDPKLANQSVSETLYFRNPNDSTQILKVTKQGVRFVGSDSKALVADGVHPESLPTLTRVDIQAFKENPSLYQKLNGWLKGRVNGESTINFSNEEKAASASAVPYKDITNAHPGAARDELMQLQAKNETTPAPETTDRITQLGQQLHSYQQEAVKPIVETPTVKVSVLPFTGSKAGTWDATVSLKVGDQTFSTPLGTDTLHPTRDAAVLAAKQRVANMVQSSDIAKSDPTATAQALDQLNTATSFVPAKKGNDAVAGFAKSTDHASVPTNLGDQFEMGSYGNNAIMRKANKPDRFPAPELPTTLDHTVAAYKAGDTGFRKDNIVWLAKMQNGEMRAVITRKNAAGKEEVVNFFKIGRDPETFINDLRSNGTPDRSRTGMTGLEHQQFRPLAYGDIPSVADHAAESSNGAADTVANLEKKLRDTYAGAAQSEVEGFTKADEKLSEIATQMELAQPGERIFLEPDATREGPSVIGVPSSFPDWVPEDLRKSSLFAKVFDSLEVSKLKYPSRPNATAQRALYQAILDQLDAQLGVDTSEIRNQIMSKYEQGNKGKSAKTNSGSPEGSTAGKPAVKTETNQQLITEAKKYATPEEFVKAKQDITVPKLGRNYTMSEYKTWKKARMFKDSIPLSELEKTNPDYIQNITNPDGTVTIYRNTGQHTQRELNHGDFVSHYKDYVKGFKAGGNVIEEKVPIKNLRIPKDTDSASKGELFYVKTKSQLTDIWNEAHATTPEVKPKPKTGGNVTLNSGVNPHFDVFLEQDLKPAVTGMGKGVADTWDLMKKLLVPTSRGEMARFSAMVLRKELGALARSRTLVFESMKKARAIFDRMTPEESIEFINNFETGKPNPGFEKFSAVAREAMDVRWKRIQAIKGSEAYIENYYPHNYKDPEKASQVLAGFGRRPLEGTKGYMKQRKIPTIKESIALGLEPATYNPVDAIMAHINDMDRFLMAHDVVEQYKEMGLIKFVPVGKKPPTGWIRPNDRSMTAWFTPTTKEWYDAQVMDQINQILDNFGIKHERGNAPELRGKKLGVSLTGQKMVKTKANTPERTLLHEIGHQLDEKYNFYDRVMNEGKDLGLATRYAQQMRKLADMRFEGVGDQVSDNYKKYVRKKEEKVAVMFEAYLHMPDRFKKVAPDVYSAFYTTLLHIPELNPVANIEKSLVYGSHETTINVLAKGGDWYMPEPAATVLNNYLSPGLRGNPLYNGFRMLGNNLNMVQLGLSAFHAGFTSADAVISKAALEIQKATQSSTLGMGKVAAAAKAASIPVTAPYYLWANLVRGNKLLQDYYRNDPEIGEMVDAMIRAGGRVNMDAFYLNNSVENFLKAVRAQNYVGAFIRTPGAVIETLAKPIMQYLVPRQKLGVFADLARNVLDQAQKEGWSDDLTTLRLQEAWDAVDNRMGQMVYDNLFWDKNVKDMGMVMTRSLGWNLGTLRIAGSAAHDYGAAGKNAGKRIFGKGEKIRMTPSMAYVLALPYVAAIWGAMIYYMYNGKGPDTLLDYFYPKTGKYKLDGTPERITLPTYMKDVFAYREEGWQTVVNKLHPEISSIIDMLENKDYFGTEIRNPNDPLVKQIEDLAAYQAKQFIPFSVSNYLQRTKSEKPSLKLALETFAGLTPAPGYITKSPIQKRITALYDKRFGGGVLSKDEKAKQMAKANARTLYMEGKTAEANAALKQLVKDGIVKNTSTFVRDANVPAYVKLFQRLPAEDQTALLKDMNLAELARYAWYATPDVRAKLSTLGDNAKAFESLVKAGQVKKPHWVRGQDTNFTTP